MQGLQGSGLKESVMEGKGGEGDQGRDIFLDKQGVVGYCFTSGEGRRDTAGAGACIIARIASSCAWGRATKAHGGTPYP